MLVLIIGCHLGPHLHSRQKETVSPQTRIQTASGRNITPFLSSFGSLQKNCYLRDDAPKDKRNGMILTNNKGLAAVITHPDACSFHLDQRPNSIRDDHSLLQAPIVIASLPVTNPLEVS
jgi:hypothetical protein